MFVYQLYASVVVRSLDKACYDMCHTLLYILSHSIEKSFSFNRKVSRDHQTYAKYIIHIVSLIVFEWILRQCITITFTQDQNIYNEATKWFIQVWKIFNNETQHYRTTAGVRKIGM